MDLANRSDVTTSRSMRLTDKPAVGVSATDIGRDAIARVVLRASKRGHAVMLAYNTENEVEGLEFLDAFDVVLRVERPPNTDSAMEMLTEAAQVQGFPGLIYHDTNRRIDYERTIGKLEKGDFAIRAHIERTAEDGKQETVAAIPAYNEEASVERVVEQSLHYVDTVLVVDDGSEDETARRAEVAGACVVTHEKNRGYGAALKTAFEVAKVEGFERLVILGGDAQHDPTDIPRLLTRLEEDTVNVVIGSRNTGTSSTGMPIVRRAGFTVINVLTNLSLGVLRRESWVRDTQSGFRAYDRSVIQTLAADETIGDHMNASTDILYHAHHHGHGLAEVGVEIDYNVEHRSSYHPLVHGVVLVSNILRTIERERPLTLIGIPGFGVSLLGLIAGYWTIVEFIRSGMVPFAPALLATLLVLVGTLACFTSLVLHSINTHLYPLERRRRGGLRGD